MLCWILIVGGLLIMMGQCDRSEALFYYFRLEDRVPENHLPRLIEKHIGFEFVRERLKDSYSDTGRPSIDPELLLRILLIGRKKIVCGKSNERQETELDLPGLFVLYCKTNEPWRTSRIAGAHHPARAGASGWWCPWNDCATRD